MNRLPRRRFVKLCLSFGVLATALKAPILWMRETLAAWPEDAFRAPSVSAAIRALFGALPVKESDQVRLKLPGLAEDGAVVPIEIEWELPAVQQIALFAHKNPVPLIASFVLADQRLQGYLATRNKAGPVLRRACGCKIERYPVCGPPFRHRNQGRLRLTAMSPTIKMRIDKERGFTTVRALIRHPMETGARKDPNSGHIIPEHYIKELVCEHNGAPVMSTYWGTGIAADPVVAFRIAGVRGGDSITVRWSDNRGRSDSLTVSA